VRFAPYDPDARGWVRDRDRDMHAPIPCDYRAAIRRALELHEGPGGTAMSFRAIGVVMAQYHGWHRSPAWWQEHLNRAGATKRPRGRPLRGKESAVRTEPRGLAGYLAGVYDGPGGTSPSTQETPCSQTSTTC
jgi:hypothetical protein